MQAGEQGSGLVAASPLLPARPGTGGRLSWRLVPHRWPIGGRKVGNSPAQGAPLTACNRCFLELQGTKQTAKPQGSLLQRSRNADLEDRLGCLCASTPVLFLQHSGATLESVRCTGNPLIQTAVRRSDSPLSLRHKAGFGRDALHHPTALSCHVRGGLAKGDTGEAVTQNQDPHTPARRGGAQGRGTRCSHTLTSGSCVWSLGRYYFC